MPMLLLTVILRYGIEMHCAMYHRMTLGTRIVYSELSIERSGHAEAGPDHSAAGDTVWRALHRRHGQTCEGIAHTSIQPIWVFKTKPIAL